MNDSARSFVSAAIPYVNSTPHLGHALELVQADALARYHRGRGRDVRFTTGTDDNSLKNVRAAEREHTTPAELVGRYGGEFRRLADALHVSYDDFLHTASDARHVPAVHELWRRCQAAGDVYRKSYRGLYCVGCEHFLRESELIDGGCPVHPGPLEVVEEENWFFRLSRYESAILEAIDSDRLRISPKERKREVCRFIEGGLTDFSISRSRARAGGWGIPVPGDESQIVYVWFDALASYLSNLGFPNGTDYERYWPSALEREHVIGKDIVRFHALYWPAILLSAGLPLPTSLRVHGHITRDGEKLGKSRGNAIDPWQLAERYGVDGLRYYLLGQLHTTKDSDFKEDLLRAAYSSELAGKLGNLLQRVTTLCVRHGVSGVLTLPLGPREASLADVAREAARAVDAGLEAFAFQDALRAVFEFVTAANRYADESAPWRLAKLRENAPPLKRAPLDTALHASLAALIESLRVSALLLRPFLPTTSNAILNRLGYADTETNATFGGASGEPKPRLGDVLFPPLERR